MRAVILAAGRGSRLGRLTEDRPKCLVEVLGRSLLDFQLRALSTAGMEEIAIVTGFAADRLDRYGLRTFHNTNWHSTNMVQSLLCADLWLAEQATIVAYSDIVYQARDVSALAAALGAPISIAYDRDWFALWRRRFTDPLSDAECFALDLTGRVRKIGGRAHDIAEIEGQYVGLLRFEPGGWAQFRSCLSRLPADVQMSIDMTSLLSLLVADGLNLGAVPIEGPWCEVDQPDDVAVAEEVFTKCE